MPSTTPQAVSALLRRKGMNPVGSRRREGVYVSRSHNGVSVSVSIDDSSRRERELADLAETILTGEGYEVSRRGNSMHVSGRVDEVATAPER